MEVASRCFLGVVFSIMKNVSFITMSFAAVVVVVSVSIISMYVLLVSKEVEIYVASL